MRIRLLIIALLTLLAVPAAAQASPRQVMTFEAPDELFDDGRRDATLDEIKAFGVTQIRQLVYWQQFAPSPTRKTQAELQRLESRRVSGGTWGRLDRLIAAAQARGINVMLTPTGPVPEVGHQEQEGNFVDRPSPKLFGQFVTALARRYGDSVATWSVWNEPNQPQFLMPQYRKKQAVLADALPQPLPRRVQGDPQRRRPTGGTRS